MEATWQRLGIYYRKLYEIEPRDFNEATSETKLINLVSVAVNHDYYPHNNNYITSNYF